MADEMVAGPSSGGASSPVPTLLDDGTLLHGHMAVGRIEGGLLTVNLGWCRMAGLSVRVEDDPMVERHRNGAVVERLLDAGAQ